jgi:hypothetical protein
MRGKQPIFSTNMAEKQAKKSPKFVPKTCPKSEK